MDNRSGYLAERQAEICRIFANATRIQILWVLANSDLSVGEIAEEVNASLPNTSHHLRFMRDKGILRSYRAGKQVYYQIARPDLVQRLLSNAPARSEQIR
jgi:DNA-binding transcriptional ArsR family regulator